MSTHPGYEFILKKYFICLIINPKWIKGLWKMFRKELCDAEGIGQFDGLILRHLLKRVVNLISFLMPLA